MKRNVGMHVCLRKGGHGGEFDKHVVSVLANVESLRRQKLVLAAKHFRLQNVFLARQQRITFGAHYQHRDVTFGKVFLK